MRHSSHPQSSLARMSNSTFFTDLHVPFDLRLNEEDECGTSSSKRNNDDDENEGWGAMANSEQISVSKVWLAVTVCT